MTLTVLTWGGGVTSYIWHSTEVRAESSSSGALFSVLPGIWLATKSIWLTQFFLICMWKALLFWYPGICVYFFAQRFFEAACSLGIQWIDCNIHLLPTINWYKKSKGSIWIGQHFGQSSLWLGLKNAKQMIHMKCQDLFSLKKKMEEKKSKLSCD